MENMPMPKSQHHILLNLNIKSRFWLALLLCIPILVVNIGNDFFHLQHFMNEKTSFYLEFILSLFVVWGCGSFFFTKAWKSLLGHKLNMFTLIALAVGVAWFYSLFALFAPENFPPHFRLPNGLVPVYFSAAAYVTVLVLLGQYIEMTARMRVNKDIASHLKGDLTPAERKSIKDMLAKAHDTEIPLQKLIDKIAEIFILAVIVIAILAFGFWKHYGPQPSGAYALIMAVSVLLAACPCALTLAVPVSIMIALNKAAHKGILINNADVIEHIHNGADVHDLEQQKSITYIDEDTPEALEQSDVVLLNRKIKPEDLICFSGQVMHNIKENLVLGVSYNLIMVPIAAGILYPLWGIMVGPVVASATMSISSIAVVLNALRLKREL